MWKDTAPRCQRASFHQRRTVAKYPSSIFPGNSKLGEPLSSKSKECRARRTKTIFRLGFEKLEPAAEVCVRAVDVRILDDRIEAAVRFRAKGTIRMAVVT